MADPSTTLDDVSVSAPAPAAQPAPTGVPYAVRKIDVTFQLGTGAFGGSNPTTFTLRGARVICHVDNVVSPMMGSHLVMKVYGMTLNHMNQCSVAGLLFDGRQNYVLVEAGDDTAGMATVFKGLIVEAYPSLDSADDAHFFVFANVSAAAQFKPVPPTSYPGSVPASQAIQSAAKTAGFSFQNNGVTAVLSAPYFAGTAWDQIRACVKAAGCFGFLHGPTNTLSIWPKTGPTQSSSQPSNSTSGSGGSSGMITVSPQTGMIGYPKFQLKTIIVRTLYSAKMVPKPGDTVLIQSQLTAANNAKIVVTKVEFDLASQMPGGPWEITIEGTPPK